MAVPDALGGMPDGALGMVETVGLVAAVEAADAMLKAADVRVVRQSRTVPALITHVVVGETAAVRAAVDAGVAAAERVGKVAASHVIPRPDASVWRLLVGPGAAPRPPASGSGSGEPGDDYDDRTVRELRADARDRDDPRLQGRDIASATKAELVEFLRRLDAEG